MASLILIVLLTGGAAQGGEPPKQWAYRAILQVKEGPLRGPNRVVKARINFTALIAALKGKKRFDQYSLRVEALDGTAPGRGLPFRFDSGPRRHTRPRRRRLRRERAVLQRPG